MPLDLRKLEEGLKDALANETTESVDRWFEDYERKEKACAIAERRRLGHMRRRGKGVRVLDCRLCMRWGYSNKYVYFYSKRTRELLMRGDNWKFNFELYYE